MDAHSPNDPSTILISRRALLQNAEYQRSRIDQRWRLCAVLARDACAHGTSLVAETLSDFTLGNGKRPVDEIAVETFQDAYAIGPCSLPTQVLFPVTRENHVSEKAAIEMAVERGWTITLRDWQAAAAVSRLARGMSRRARVHWLVQSRAGESPTAADLAQQVRPIFSLPSLHLSGIAIQSICAKTLDPETESCNDGAACVPDHWIVGEPIVLKIQSIEVNTSVFRRFRSSVTLYGAAPNANDAAGKLAMRWSTNLQCVRTVEAGTSFNFGRTWRASRTTRLGIMPVGFAHGICPEYAGRAFAKVRGRLHPIIGRVALGASLLDLSDCPMAKFGDAVELLDDSENSLLSPQYLAGLIGSTSIEVLISIGSQSPRRPINDVAVRRSSMEGTAA